MKGSWFGIGFLGLVLGTQALAESKWIWRLEERVRLEAWDNTVGLNEDADLGRAYNRYRTQGQVVYTPTPALSFGIRITNEFRTYFKPSDMEFTIHEFVLDNLYFQLRRPWNSPFSFTVGRQDIFLGEGFLVVDGTPGDGSRTNYFNAARMDIHLGESKTLSAFVMTQRDEEQILPLVNSQDQVLLERPERAWGVVYSGRHGNTGLEGYYLWKHAKETAAFAAATVHTVGGRIQLPLVQNLSAAGEAAAQFGSYGDEESSGFGGYFHLDYRKEARFPVPTGVTLGTLFLSGDDPDTDKQEGWDPLFSRYPKWSDSFIYALIPEMDGRVAYWTNYVSLYTRLRFRIARPLRASFSVHHLLAPQTMQPTSTLPAGDGKTRGWLFVTRFDGRIARQFRSHFLWEYFAPGNFYGAEADAYHWFQVQVSCLLTNAAPSESE